MLERTGALKRLDDAPRLRRVHVAGVRRTLPLDQQEVRFFRGDRSMLDALGHNKKFARGERDHTVAQFDVDGAVEHEKEIDHQIVAIEGADSARLPQLAKSGELFAKIDWEMTR